MNVSKRTWIVLGIAIVAILAAFASLYFEKESEIQTLENIEPSPEPEKEKPVRMTIKSKNKEVVPPEMVDLNSDSNGNEQK